MSHPTADFSFVDYNRFLYTLALHLCPEPDVKVGLDCIDGKILLTPYTIGDIERRHESVVTLLNAAEI